MPPIAINNQAVHSFSTLTLHDFSMIKNHTNP